MYVSAWSKAYCNILLMSFSMYDLEVAASREGCNEQEGIKVSAYREAWPIG